MENTGNRLPNKISFEYISVLFGKLFKSLKSIDIDPLASFRLFDHLSTHVMFKDQFSYYVREICAAKMLNDDLNDMFDFIDEEKRGYIYDEEYYKTVNKILNSNKKKFVFPVLF